MSQDQLELVRSELVRTAGGFLRNLILPPSACRRCHTPVVNAQLCDKCLVQSRSGDLPDLIGFLTYATYANPVPQSGRTMRAYKWDFPNPSAQQTVQLLAALGLRGHHACASRLVGVPITAWATVPSGSGKPSHEHPLNRIVSALSNPRASQVSLVAHIVGDPRDVNSANFSVLDSIPSRSHVLLVDDTWTGGGHAQSAALALRQAGAEYVTLLVLARWLSEGFGHTTPPG